MHFRGGEFGVGDRAGEDRSLVNLIRIASVIVRLHLSASLLWKVELDWCLLASSRLLSLALINLSCRTAGGVRKLEIGFESWMRWFDLFDGLTP